MWFNKMIPIYTSQTPFDAVGEVNDFSVQNLNKDDLWRMDTNGRFSAIL